MTSLDDFSKRARRAMDDAQPAFDEAAGRRRLLAALPAGKKGAALRWWLGVGAVAAAALLAVVGAWRTRSGEYVVATQSAVTVPFEEGSSAVVSPGSELRIEARTPDGARVEVLRGRVDVAVTHRPRTDWHVRAGPWDVAVTGTTLSVEWHPAERRVEVAVFEGVVEVRRADGPTTTVRALERFDSRVGLIRPQPALPSPPRPAPEPTPAQRAPEWLSPSVIAFDAGPGDRPPPGPRARPWVELEVAGRYLEALDAVRAAGSLKVLAKAVPDELLAIARAARFAGDGALATEALLTTRRRFTGSSQAAMAAFLLAREARGDEAVSWLQRYLAEEPDGALTREAAGRLLEALMQAGRYAEARTAATSYLARFPTGPHAPYARSLTEEP